MTLNSTRRHVHAAIKLAALATASSLILASAATAETAPTAAAAASGIGVGEVVVTAQRRESNLQKTPIAISAFDAKTLADRKVDSIRDLAGQIPNFSIARANISYTTQTYSLRGVGETDPIQEPVVAVYVDDVYQPRQIGSMLDFNDIQRVEVLRGPQGALYGRNSSAGALRVITNEPTKTFHTDDSLTYGGYNDLEARALISGPILGDDLTGSLSYLHHSRDGVTHDPPLGHDVNRIDLDAARVKLRWTPGKWDIEGVLNVLKDRSDTRSYIPAAQPGGFATRTSYSEVEPYQHLDQISGSVRAIYALTDHLKVKSISSYGGFNLNPVNYDNDGQAALVQKNLIHYNDQYYTEELQLNGDYGRFNFSTGFFYLHERFFVQRDGYSRKNALATDPTVTPSNYSFLRAHNVTNTDSYALFGEANWKITDKLILTTGVRETVETKTFTFNNSTLNLTGQVTAPSIKGQADHTWSAFTPKVSLSYQWTPDLLQYVTYSKGFKSGGFDNRATILALAETPFNPEFVNSYETGLKSEWFDHHLRANLALFYNQYDNLQVSYYDPAKVASVRGNAGQAHTEGVELETDARVTDALSLQASAGYLFAIYDNYKNAGGAGVNADGHTLINAPRWTLSGGFGYDLPIHIAGSLRLTVDAQYATKYYSSALNRPLDQVPAQGFLNANLTWTSEDSHWSAILSGRNILDSQKPVSASYTPSSGILFYNFADPATARLTIKYQL
ncbi:MAG: TonB-dependent receptor [Caulobacteraceae bacterium]|nr:TonB-dependent receptor [Caulobacteraceae bacterium]